MVSNGQATVHLGNYTEYRNKTGDAHGKQQSDPDVLMIRKREKVKKIDSRDDQKERGRQKRKLKTLEDQISTIEQMIDTFDTQFIEVDQSDYAALGELTAQKDGLGNDLKELYDEWEVISAAIS